MSYIILSIKEPVLGNLLDLIQLFTNSIKNAFPEPYYRVFESFNDYEDAIRV